MCLFDSLPSCAVTALAQDGWSSWVLCGGGLWCLCHPRERWRIVLLLEMEPEQHNPFPAGPSVFSVSSTRVGWWQGGRARAHRAALGDTCCCWQHFTTYAVTASARQSGAGTTASHSSTGISGHGFTPNSTSNSLARKRKTRKLGPLFFN